MAIKTKVTGFNALFRYLLCIVTIGLLEFIEPTITFPFSHTQKGLLGKAFPLHCCPENLGYDDIERNELDSGVFITQVQRRIGSRRSPQAEFNNRDHLSTGQRQKIVEKAAKVFPNEKEKVVNPKTLEFPGLIDVLKHARTLHLDENNPNNVVGNRVNRLQNTPAFPDFLFREPVRMKRSWIRKEIGVTAGVREFVAHLQNRGRLLLEKMGPSENAQVFLKTSPSKVQAAEPARTTARILSKFRGLKNPSLVDY